MLFSLIIKQGPYQHQSPLSAIHFVRATFQQGHRIKRIFFYHDGVLNASQLIIPPQDEANIPELWAQLAIQYNIELIVCVAAARRRGLISEQIMKLESKSHYNLHPAFSISGLGQWVEAISEAERVISFG